MQFDELTTVQTVGSSNSQSFKTDSKFFVCMLYVRKDDRLLKEMNRSVGCCCNMLYVVGRGVAKCLREERGEKVAGKSGTWVWIFLWIFDST